jgi:hypothetical protein
MSKETLYKLLNEAWADRKWAAHLTYEQIVEQWVHEKGAK